MSKWFKEQRQQFISDSITSAGWINRDVIKDWFAISPATATRDLPCNSNKRFEGVAEEQS